MLDYDNILNDRIKLVKPSKIRKFFDITDQVDDVISLGVGQPDFLTPWHIRRAGIEALQDGKTFYTANSGLIELRREISNYLTRRFDIQYNPDNEIIVTVGGSEGIDLAIRVLVQPGDEAIVVEPAFVCYTPDIEMCGAKVVHLATRKEDNFKLTAQSLKKAITPKTKLLVLPFPNNPTGAIMEQKDLEEIAEVLRGTDIMVISDEIYAELTYGGHKHVSIASIPDMWERTIIVSGFSKCYAMTGWRLGYVCAPAPITKAIYKAHQYAIMCAPTSSQYAAIEALKNGDEDIEYMVGEYDKRRKLVLSELNRIGMDCTEPLGGFYFFPSIERFGLTSDEFCEKLLFEHKVAVIPGTAFGDSGEGHCRVSYAYSTQNLLAAIGRIEPFLKKLGG